MAYDNETISVVIPVYNISKKLNVLFDSIEKQTYKNTQIILVDDGSTDDSLKFCEEFCKRNSFARCYTKPNGGVSSARNYGLRYATGKYICFVDSDDYLESEYFQKLYNAIKNNNYDFSMCGLYEVIDGEKYACNSDKSLCGNNHNGDLFEALFNSCWFPVPWNKIFKLSIIKNNKLTFDKKITYDEDTIFNLKYYALARYISIIPDNLYNYISSQNSLTRIGEKQIFINSLKTIPYRLKYPKYLFGHNKKAIYISAKKILKAVIQEANANKKDNMPLSKIEEIYRSRLNNKYVKETIGLISILENNYKEYFAYKKIFCNGNFNELFNFILK